MDLQPDPWFVVTVALDTNYDNLSSLSIISAPQFKRSVSGRSTVGGTLERGVLSIPMMMMVFRFQTERR